jgi:hypothetical protein
MIRRAEEFFGVTQFVNKETNSGSVLHHSNIHGPRSHFGNYYLCLGKEKQSELWLLHSLRNFGCDNSVDSSKNKTLAW